MNVTDDFDVQLAQLHEPAPPASLTATVMARIAREADERHVMAAEESTARRRQDRRAWLWMLAGLAVVFGTSLYAWLQAGSLPDFLSPRVGPGVTLFPMQGPAALLVGLGLLIYMAGLLAPLRHGRRR